MSFISDLIQEAIDKGQRDDGEILFVDEFYMDWDKWFQQTELYTMWWDQWLCTDTHVGGKIMFFREIPFGLTYQSARKSDKIIVIFDKEVAEVVRTFLQEMLSEDPFGYPVVNMDFSKKDLEQLSYVRNR